MAEPCPAGLLSGAGARRRCDRSEIVCIYLEVQQCGSPGLGPLPPIHLKRRSNKDTYALWICIRESNLFFPSPRSL
eukprot:4224971-Amphidinium_carterae.1